MMWWDITWTGWLHCYTWCILCIYLNATLHIAVQINCEFYVTFLNMDMHMGAASWALWLRLGYIDDKACKMKQLVMQSIMSFEWLNFLKSEYKFLLPNYLPISIGRNILKIPIGISRTQTLKDSDRIHPAVYSLIREIFLNVISL